MIRIPITPSDILSAKEMTKEFDKQKTYNKVESANNFLGILSEGLLHRYWKYVKMPHEWVTFVKQGIEQPDFIINEQSIDLKCTFYNQMAMERPKFDWYIFSRVNKDLKTLFVIGYIKKQKLLELMQAGKIERKVANGRTFYLVNIKQMRPIEEFPNGL